MTRPLVTVADNRPITLTLTPDQLAAAFVLADVIAAHAPARTLETGRTRELVPTERREVALVASARPMTGRLAAVLAVGAAVDTGVLGTAGVLFGQSAAGHALLYGMFTGAGGLLLALLLLGMFTGVVHCPGCPI